jgi:hypothetical protein
VTDTSTALLDYATNHLCQRDARVAFPMLEAADGSKAERKGQMLEVFRLFFGREGKVFHQPRWTG